VGDEIRRIAETEALFREVNEGIAETADRFDISEAEFLCECADPSCAERIETTLPEYEGVRSESTQFMLVPGHDIPEIEEVVTERPGHSVVEKVEPAVAQLVTRLDPRAEPA
jgi:hypothetical protein